MNLTFITEEINKTMPYADYLNNQELRDMVNDPDRFRLDLGGTMISFDRDWLDGNEEQHNHILTLKEMQEENPLQFFMPSCLDPERLSIPDDIDLGMNYDGGALEFLNDTTSSIKAIVAGNRRGKTATSIIDQLLDAIPTSPEWPLFKIHGVKWRKFYRPLQIGFATSDWGVASKVLWPELRKWIPRYELGDYDPRQKNAKEIAWRVNPYIKLLCGTEIYFFCYEQKQGPFEGQALDRWYWDEQGEEPKFDGADERLRTRKGRHGFGLTPHKVEGRPDTGARSWIHTMLKQKHGKGHTIRAYMVAPDDVPDWVYPETEKAKAHEKWIEEPTKNNNIKVLKEGLSRYYGAWHSTGGLVYDEWDEKRHLIDPFDIPDSWTRYRAIDHGINNPTACIWAAVSPNGNVVIYREYYQGGLSVYENVRRIVELSGNVLEPQGVVKQGHGVFYERFTEKCIKERFHKTVLDKRSKNTKDSSQLETGKLYRWAGLNVQDASGANTENSIPVVKQFMHVDPEKEHPFNKSIEGAPQIFVFRNLINFKREIEEYAMQEFKSAKAAAVANIKETPVKKNDHLMDAFRYLCQIPPRHIEGRWAYYVSVTELSEEEEERYDREREKKRGFSAFSRDSVTGY